MGSKPEVAEEAEDAEVVLVNPFTTLLKNLNSKATTNTPERNTNTTITMIPSTRSMGRHAISLHEVKEAEHGEVEINQQMEVGSNTLSRVSNTKDKLARRQTNKTSNNINDQLVKGAAIDKTINANSSITVRAITKSDVKTKIDAEVISNEMTTFTTRNSLTTRMANINHVLIQKCNVVEIEAAAESGTLITMIRAICQTWATILRKAPL